MTYVSMKYTVSLPEVTLHAPEGEMTEDEFKEWFLEHHRQTLRKKLLVQPNQDHHRPQEEVIFQRRNWVPEIETEYTLKDSDETSSMNDSKYKKQLRLLSHVAEVQAKYLQSEGPKKVYGLLLEGLLDFMDSEYGFIGETKYSEDTGEMYLQTHAITNIAWDEATEEFYAQNIHNGLTFYNMESLFGFVLKNKVTLIANDPASHPSATGIPPGHPPLNHFLGIPFFDRSGNIIGMCGIANKPGGYDEDDVRFIEPFITTCSNLIQAYWQIQENQKLIDTLEEKVFERTRKLELANQSLEEANLRVRQASQAQLQNFACMSHEIRTPLNCIIGLSSLLQESELNPVQQESVNMINSSGDLLLAVVNDVLDYSKLETGNVEITIQRSNLQDTLAGVVHSIELRAQSKRLRMVTRYDPLIPEIIYTDPRRLQQILYNILGNAVKFGREDTDLELVVSLVRIDDAKGDANGQTELDYESQLGLDGDSCHSMHIVTCDPNIMHSENNTTDAVWPDNNADTNTAWPVSTEWKLRLSVKDRGKGIAKCDFERVFKPFLQATPETEQLYGGTGLGLAITAKLVCGLGGSISVSSVVDQWTKFSVDLPFRGTVVEPRSLQSRLAQAFILAIVTEVATATRLKEIFTKFHIDHDIISSADDWKGCPNLNEKCLFVLFQEDLFAPHEMDHIDAQLPRRRILASFGPKFTVQGTQLHFRSINQTLPSVLLSRMVALLIDDNEECNGRKNVQATKAVPFHEYTVLIAEDNLINQKVLKRMLTRLGIERIDIANNGQEAVDMEAARRYDVVLMDAQMPVLDGLEASRRILKRPETSHERSRIVFATAHVSVEFERLCRSVGGIGFLPKPFNMRDVEACFRDLHFEKLDIN